MTYLRRNTTNNCHTKNNTSKFKDQDKPSLSLDDSSATTTTDLNTTDSSSKGPSAVFQSRWIDKDGSSIPAATSGWFEHLMGTCNAMSQEKSEKDRLTRFAQEYDRIKSQNPIHTSTNTNTNNNNHKINQDESQKAMVGMLQAFQLCLTLEKLGKQMEDITGPSKKP